MIPNDNNNTEYNKKKLKKKNNNKMDNLNHHPFCLLLPPSSTLVSSSSQVRIRVEVFGIKPWVRVRVRVPPKKPTKTSLAWSPPPNSLSLSSSYYQQRGFSFLDPHGGWLEHGGVVYGVCDFLAMERKDTQCVILLLSLLSSSLIISGNSITIENDQQYITS